MTCRTGSDNAVEIIDHSVERWLLTEEPMRLILSLPTILCDGCNSQCKFLNSTSNRKASAVFKAQNLSTNFCNTLSTDLSPDLLLRRGFGAELNC